jgi:FimV-like protein
MNVRVSAGRGAVYEEDYLLRIIQQAGVFLRAMLAAQRDHRPDEIRETSREALTLLLGVPPALTDSLTPDGLVTLLSVGGRFETVRAVLAAEVFVRRALADRVSGLSESAAADEVRARRLLDEVISAGGDENVERAQALLAELDETAGEGTSE